MNKRNLLVASDVVIVSLFAVWAVLSIPHIGRLGILAVIGAILSGVYLIARLTRIYLVEKTATDFLSQRNDLMARLIVIRHWCKKTYPSLRGISPWASRLGHDIEGISLDIDRELEGMDPNEEVS